RAAPAVRHGGRRTDRAAETPWWAGSLAADSARGMVRSWSAAAGKLRRTTVRAPIPWRNLMRRAALAPLALTAVLLGATPASAGTGPGWEPAPSAPWDVAAGARCDFPVHGEPVVDEVVQRVLSTYPDGSPRRIAYKGDLVVRVTNTETGAHHDADASGPAPVELRRDGSHARSLPVPGRVRPGRPPARRLPVLDRRRPGAGRRGGGQPAARPLHRRRGVHDGHQRLRPQGRPPPPRNDRRPLRAHRLTLLCRARAAPDARARGRPDAPTQRARRAIR